jgi:hypothetical protein
LLHWVAVAVPTITVVVLPQQVLQAAAVASVPRLPIVWVQLARRVRALPVAMQALAISTDPLAVAVVREVQELTSLGPQAVLVALV